MTPAVKPPKCPKCGRDLQLASIRNPDGKTFVAVRCTGVPTQECDTVQPLIQSDAKPPIVISQRGA